MDQSEHSQAAYRGRGTRDETSTHWRGRWLATICCVAAGILWWTRPAFPVVVEGVSMEPTFLDGQVVWASSWVRPNQIRIGDVVIIRDPDKETLIKRVAYVAGERFLEVRLGNGSWLPLCSFDRLSKRADPVAYLRRHRYQWRPGHVPPDHVYVLGDNTLNSDDSKVFGCLPLADIKGIVLSHGRVDEEPQPRHMTM